MRTVSGKLKALGDLYFPVKDKEINNQDHILDLIDIIVNFYSSDEVATKDFDYISKWLQLCSFVDRRFIPAERF